MLHSVSLMVLLLQLPLPLLITSAAHVEQVQQVEQVAKVKSDNVTLVRELEKYNYLVGIIGIGVEREYNTKCGQELEIMLNAINSKQLWALKVLDSFGHAPRSFTWGNYFWFSSRELCDELNEPYAITFSREQHLKVKNYFNITSPFAMRYQIAYMNFQTPHYIDLKLPFENLLHIGLCLPRSCNATALLRYTELYFRTEVFEMQRNFHIKLSPRAIKTPMFSWSFFTQTGSIVLLILAFIIITLCILAEVQFRCVRKLKLQQQLLMKFTQNLENTKNPSMVECLLECFCLRTNYKHLTTLDMKNTQYLGAIAGLRTIICLWVTVFHVYYYSLFAMTNAPMIFAKLESFILQPVIQACFYVDVFFAISAFLLVYNFLSNQKQMGTIRSNGACANIKLYLKSVFRRYMRLTPIMIVTILLSNMVSDFINMFTPFHLGVNSGIYCKANWWHNLLYVHNMLNMKNICCSWTWYLGCEMQYFLLFTLLLYVYAKWPKLTKIIYTTLALGFVVIGWMCNYRYGITFQIDVIYSTLDELYVKPWVRIMPYIGGALMGWLFARWHEERQLLAHRHIRNTDANTDNNNCNGKHNIDSHGSNGKQNSNCGSVSGNTNNSGSCNAHAHAVAANVTSEQHRMELRAVWLAAFWFVCVCLYVTTNFMSYWRSTPTWLVSTIMSLGKLLFALCFGGIIILCAAGKARTLNVLLSARLFLFLNKLCFSIYMIAPVIVYAAYGLRNEATTFSEVGSAIDFSGIVLLSIASAFVLVLLIELPMQRLADVLLQRRLHSKPMQKQQIFNINCSCVS